MWLDFPMEEILYNPILDLVNYTTSPEIHSLLVRLSDKSKGKRPNGPEKGTRSRGAEEEN